ncbi:hypothetical protein L103DPR2_02472 [Limnohabitans sp. 103DPR2]|nr:hypothetical protein L103DPR2_02472 [Limnohabitans sp. 103DPR2]
MTDIQTIDMSIGVLIIAVAVLYAAWYEYRKKINKTPSCYSQPACSV